MAHLENRDKRESQLYDANIRGFDQSFWEALSGTPSGTPPGNPITLNAAAIVSYPQYLFPEKAEFFMKVPAAPVGGQAERRWGFLSPASNNAGGMYFHTNGATFEAVVYDNAGNPQTSPITWSAGYTNTNTKFQILGEPYSVIFKINDVIVASFVVTSGASPKALPAGPLPIYISNLVADNLTITYIELIRPADIVS